MAAALAGNAAVAVVLPFVPARILHALSARRRYKYVHPRVEAEGAGWKIVSPNCSRNIDPAGGEIDIAWIVAAPRGSWRVHARDHRRQAWKLRDTTTSLDEALERVCADPLREYWP
ncbi:MAG: hypothetical protein KGN16_25275 [Burkholderiales bacterium]|nr:hypothetical protein [Burkholderiales bacterium]